MKQSDVVVLGVGAAHTRRIRDALRGVSSGVTLIKHDPPDLQLLLDGLVDQQPSVVVLGPHLKGANQFDLIRSVLGVDPTIGVLIIDSPTEALAIKALEAGARGVLAPDSSVAETRITFERLIAAAGILRKHRLSGVTESGGGRSIVVLSAKGGAGKTMVAVNLAVAIAENNRRQTAILDLDFQFGDVASALLLVPEHTVADAVAATGLTSAGKTALKVFLTRHPPSELFALCAPEDPADSEKIGVDTIGAILEALSREFSYIVVDTSAGLTEPTLAALDLADDIVIVVDMDVPSVRGGRKLLTALDRIGLTRARRHVVLNRADSKVGLSQVDVVEALGISIDVFLPSTRSVPRSFNLGQPLVSTTPRDRFSRGIRLLAKRVTTVPRTQEMIR